MSDLIKTLKSTGAYQLFRKSGSQLRKVYKRFLLKRRLKKAAPVLIYQMGKVASSSIHHSLKKQYPGAVAHAHHIGGDNWASELFYEWFKSGIPIKIISPAREPIGRNISSFFQTIERYVGEEFNHSDLPIEKLIDSFINNFPHTQPLTWFDDNIKKHFGVDIYATEFPADSAATYSQGNVSLLVFRVDLPDPQKEKAIRNFLEFDSFKLNNRNVSANKEYYDTYKTFISKIKLPEPLLSSMRNSKYFNYFYTNDEIDKIISKFK